MSCTEWHPFRDTVLTTNSSPSKNSWMTTTFLSCENTPFLPTLACTAKLSCASSLQRKTPSLAPLFTGFATTGKLKPSSFRRETASSTVLASTCRAPAPQCRSTACCIWNLSTRSCEVAGSFPRSGRHKALESLSVTGIKSSKGAGIAPMSSVSPAAWLILDAVFSMSALLLPSMSTQRYTKACSGCRDRPPAFSTSSTNS
mmetsp:Transcript_49135/g.88304  ORF Transcript_49135/g.88304 Transcript_49135/m.88304 type:complete len:201 (-) Transcript_49135:46-648(-)